MVKRLNWRPIGAANIKNAARCLVGLTLADGWLVKALVERPLTATGGTFSVGYIAEKGGRRAFVKALDYSEAFAASNTPEILKYMTEAYTFERAVLEQCRSRRMSRVAMAIEHGSVEVSDCGAYSKVDYLILEYADHDARTHIDMAAAFDAAWRVRAIHQAATGLRQLHGGGIAHQDLKPSNVLVFEGEGSKVGDLGRSARDGHPSPHDQYQVAGDVGYSAPELLYGYLDPNFGPRRFGGDIYMLGSLVYFFFTGVSLTATILGFLHPSHLPREWGGDYATVLPYVRDAFDRAVVIFEDAARRIVAQHIAEDLTAVLRQLCDPDPLRRGDPKNRVAGRNAFSLERYVTKLDVLASRLEMRLASDEPTPRR